MPVESCETVIAMPQCATTMARNAARWGRWSLPEPWRRDFEASVKDVESLREGSVKFLRKGSVKQCKVCGAPDSMLRQRKVSRFCVEADPSRSAAGVSCVESIGKPIGMTW